MGQDLKFYRQVGVFSLSNRLVGMGSIPQNDDDCEQVEISHTVVFALARAAGDFAVASDAERVLECVMNIVLVQANVGSALPIRTWLPFDNEECSFDPPDFAESDGQFVLAWIGRKLSQRWFSGRMPLARVAATRRMSGQFRTITSSRI